ncbi:MAG: heavy-metal-associated domain-containing protein [Pseudomonadales bacterium]|nr:heavy-metal-associated domain-containing protein [Candidatus Woesebacteria bacterium]MCB9801640.1 heavy-metal-associated domain-containing protein [Pseudomonadales bacterium]
MFGIFKKTPQGTTVVFKIDGMHCASCSMNITAELEEIPGVISADTSYAKALTTVVYDEEKTSPKTIRSVIESLEYSAIQV